MIPSSRTSRTSRTPADQPERRDDVRDVPDVRPRRSWRCRRGTHQHRRGRRDLRDVRDVRFTRLTATPAARSTRPSLSRPRKDRAPNAQSDDPRATELAGPDRLPRVVGPNGRCIRSHRPGRKAFLDRFEKQVDPDGELLPAERARRAEHARKAYFARLAFKSARECSVTRRPDDVRRLVAAPLDQG